MRPAALLATVGLSLIALAGVSLSGAVGARAQATTTIQVGDLWFCNASFQDGVCATTVNAGDTVVWQWVGSLFHTTTECAGNLDVCPTPHLWDSPVQSSGSFSFTFATPGTYVYRCQVHPVQMRGSITVLAAAPSPTPQPSPGPPPSPSPQASPPPVTPTPVVVQPTAVPVGGGAPPVGGGPAALGWLAVAAGGLLVAAALGFALRGLRR